MKIVIDDGGRNAAGFSGSTGDCVTRALAIATGISYQDTYDAMFAGSRKLKLLKERGRSPRDGVSRKVYDPYLRSLGWKWTPTMRIGTGCRVHMKSNELPTGKIIVRLSRHLATVIDGVLHDTHDCSLGETRCVYGYYSK